MSVQFDELAPEIQSHIRTLAKQNGGGDEMIERLADAWQEKFRQFSGKTAEGNMEALDRLEVDDSRGVLMLTYSGSLLSVGPDSDDGRKVDYVSIGLRSDVPESISGEAVSFAASPECGRPVEFTAGPISKSSPIFAMAATAVDAGEEEALEQLEEMTRIISDEFAEINKTIIQE